MKISFNVKALAILALVFVGFVFFVSGKIQAQATLDSVTEVTEIIQSGLRVKSLDDFTVTYRFVSGKVVREVHVPIDPRPRLKGALPKTVLVTIVTKNTPEMTPITKEVTVPGDILKKLGV